MDQSLIELLHQIKADKSIYDRQLICTYKFGDFLDSYTLHDSYLCTLFADEDNYLTLGIRWDAFWNKEKLNISAVDTEVDMWPILFISFPVLYRINWTMFRGDVYATILDTETSVVDLRNTDDAIQKIVSTESNNRKIELVKTKFTCVDGEIELLHEDPVEFLYVRSDGALSKLYL